MNDDVSTGDDSTLGWVIGLLIVAAIVLLLAFARGPEDQDRSGASLPAPAALIT